MATQKGDELLSNYGSIEQIFKDCINLYIPKAKNEAFNLKCSHCQTLYAAFIGCMTLCYATCKGSFCGYFATNQQQHPREHMTISVSAL